MSINKLDNNILLLDDEELALSYLNDTLEMLQETNLFLKGFSIHSASKQSEFYELLKGKLPKIIFIDIQMPGKTGIEIAEDINKNHVEYGYKEKPPAIIFITAYEDYGYKAFQVNAVDYLLKPIDEDKLSNAIRKIHANNLCDANEHIFISFNGADLKIAVKDVMFFKADMKYVSVATEKKEYLINSSLTKIEESMPTFIKVHRRYLVNPSFVQKVHKRENHWILILSNGDRIPVSRRQQHEVENKLIFSH